MATFAYGISGWSDESDSSMLVATSPSTPSLQSEDNVEGPPTPENRGIDDEQPTTPSKMKPEARAYQLEMFEASLKENVIVAMDTGSGKTLVALLRMQAELDTCAPDKIVWFLAPTVMLCAQQHAAIERHMPSVSLKLLTGNENVDSWSEQIWKTVLKTRIIISTPQVLHDALSHAFVSMDMLALLVFDEAHNCTKNAPARRIMLDFYHARKGSAHIPSVLGLSATPSIRARPDDLEATEKTLDARCMSPTTHREELLRHVNRPLIRAVQIDPFPEVVTPAILSLQRVWHGLDIKDDPYVVSLLKDLTPSNERRLYKVIRGNDTYCQKQLEGLYNRSIRVASELGLWASDRYLWRVISEYLGNTRQKDHLLNQWTSEEKVYLSQALEQIQVPEPAPLPSDVSQKASLLIQELLAAANGDFGPPVCVVFARERATVSMLYELLMATPSVSEKFRIGAIVGVSQQSSKKSSIYDLLSNVNDISVLQKFRSGTVNLLIATSVLEEGIDVPACNFVICFDEVETFKSFIQRRGRARMRASCLICFIERQGRIAEQWQEMEEIMKRQYQEEDREHELLVKEEGDELGAEFVLRVESTGARIGLQEARGHLDHFCRALSRGEFIQARPDYITKMDHIDTGTVWTCTVVLPSFLPADVRKAEGSQPWPNEKAAIKDAAFQAYVKLYHAGLLNDNLLPYAPKEIPGIEAREPISLVDHSFSPWIQVARDWAAGKPRWALSLTCIGEDGEALGEYDIVLPSKLPQPRDIIIYRDHEKVWILRFSTARLLAEGDKSPDLTSVLLASVFGHRWVVLDKPQVIQICAKDSNGLSSMSSSQINARAFNVSTDQNKQTLLRDVAGMAFTFEELLPYKPPMSMVRHIFEGYEAAREDAPYVSLKRWTKRSDFLHRLAADPLATLSVKPYDWVLPVDSVMVDIMPIQHLQFGMLIPSVIHEIKIMLTVKHLMENLLKPVEFSDPYLVREAISSRAAVEPYQYERLETLGDSILKYSASIHALATHPEWPEGYLSFFKDRIVSNSRLSRAAKEKGLAKYILTKSFTGLKWRPLYLDDILEEEENAAKVDRQLSTKTLADVVEALIGAAYHEGGMEKATKCLTIFIDDQAWRTPAESRQVLYEIQPDISQVPQTVEPVEELIGYVFNKKSLLVEFLTHGSFMGTFNRRSYERLEFVGDAILDKIIVTRLFEAKPPLPHDKIHTLKTAVVNSDFLASKVFEYGLRKKEVVVVDGGIDTQESRLPLWTFMRSSSPPLDIAQQEAVKRYHDIRAELLEAMNHDTRYPWALLARLRAQKFFSDIFEAMLGAVWLDSGSLKTCEEILGRFGILETLDRILRDVVECMHPKELLGRCAVEKKVKYGIGKIDLGNGEKEYTCSVHVGDRLITEVAGGVGSEEVKTKAATEAVRILKVDQNTIDVF